MIQKISINNKFDCGIVFLILIILAQRYLHISGSYWLYLITK